MDSIWTTLYKEAKDKLNASSISPFIEYGNNSCAILGENNKIYCGINITSNTSISNSAEESAIMSMLNDKENKIKKMVILNELEEVITPSDICFDYLLEFCQNPDEVEILVDFNKKKVCKLSELIPEWWGTFRNRKN